MACLVCGSKHVVEHLDVGHHAVASFFLVEKDAPERNLALALGECETCGTIQMMEPVPHDALIPPYDWLFAREPEEHLDEVVDTIIGLAPLPRDAVIGALSYKDDTTVERFRNKGFSNTWRVSLTDDLGVTNSAANIETVQKLTNPATMRPIAARRCAADILIVRHITEHAEDVGAFMQGLAELVKPGGLLMLEVPDCTDNLRLHDYCMVWEEHSLYLTPETLSLLPSLGGFEPIKLDIFPRPFENSLVLLARKTGKPIQPGSEAARKQIGMLKTYAEAYVPAKKALRATLEKVRAEQGPIALFGAGHLAHAFTNFMDVTDLIDFVADDTPQKQGKFLPGARLPILPSAELVNRKVGLCLLALSINNENAVIARNSGFEAAGGAFRSIFRASPRSIFKDLA